MSNYKLRFHLAQGANFMKWQLTHPDGTKTYHDPETTKFHLWGCKFKNQRTTANKIHSGAHKTVCAWVEAVEVKELKNITTEQLGSRLVYNPRIQPYWHFESDPQESIDDRMMLALETHGCSIHQF
jgi:hypothetical protein